MLKSYFSDDVEAGIDEAGRGCLAGPVFAAAVILPKKFRNKWLNDSKQLNETARYALRDVIESEALGFAVALIDHAEIDKINILRASIKAMHQALDKLETEPEFILVDGNKFYTYKNIPHQTIIKGDATYMSIASASILAKTYRDDFMLKLHEKFPHYGWDKNKGYGTKDHLTAIQKFGYSTFHRKTFHVKNLIQVKLF